MREIYKKLSMAALCLLVAMSAVAQTTGYAITILCRVELKMW